jgi:hypothetical protein
MEDRECRRHVYFILACAEASFRVHAASNQQLELASLNTREIDGDLTKMLILLLIILLVLSIGSYPAWPYSRGWGYYPSGSLGLVVLILMVLLLLGHL